MRKNERGMFCKVYGDSLRNRVLEHLLELGELDFSAGDMARELGISRPKVYQIIGELESQKILVKRRIVSGVQLYNLNNELILVKILRKSFKECLKLVVDSSSKKNQKVSDEKYNLIVPV
ncbi:MAG: hypothetical protein ACP5N2_05700 [Candidatus Nanoarchaeia archaeon]